MRSTPYGRTQIVRLLPLLDSIGREIRERSEALERVEARIRELEALAATSVAHRPDETKDRLHGETAEAANQRRGIRLARKELERLGCELVETTPLTFRIPGKEGDETCDFVWQTSSAC